MRLAQSDLTGFLQTLNLNGDPTVVRDALLEFFPELVEVYGSTAAVLGADFYDMLRDVPPSAASFRAASTIPAKREQAEATARWSLGTLFLPDPDTGTVLSRLEGATQRLVWQPFRETVTLAAASDPVRTGIARVPTGATTCRFCVMLASRGPVYHTVESAGGEGHRFHDHCNCMNVVVRTPTDLPEGYDVDHYRSLYRAGAGEGRDIPA